MPEVLRSLRDTPRSAAQLRVMTAALELFADHGVSGTSLQMIADRVGVTKAAVYHQFKTKDEIVLAVAEHELAQLEAALEVAERERSRARARDRLLAEVISMAVTRRRWVRALQNDPIMVRLLASDTALVELMGRVYGLLLEGRTGPDALVAAALMGSAIGAAVVNPLVESLDDATLERELLIVARRIFVTTGR